MKNNDNKIINIIFRVVIIGAFFMGIRTIYNFYVLMITYKGISGEDMFNRVASMVDDYVMFMVFMVASVVFSVLARKLVNNNTFIIDTPGIDGIKAGYGGVRDEEDKNKKTRKNGEYKK